MIWYINRSYQLCSSEGPEEKNFKGGGMQPTEGEWRYKQAQCAVTEQASSLIHASCQRSRCATSGNIWLNINNIITSRASTKKKKVSAFPACTVKCAWEQLYALSWRQEANQMRCIPYSCDLWPHCGQNHIFADCQRREWFFFSSN